MTDVLQSSGAKNPSQPIVRDYGGYLRFKENPVVRYLLDNGGIDLNKIASIPWNQGDLEQFYQLIGYSLCGYCDLSFVSDESKNRIEGLIAGKTKKTIIDQRMVVACRSCNAAGCAICKQSGYVENIDFGTEHTYVMA